MGASSSVTSCGQAPNSNAVSSELGGQTLSPGTYSSTAAFDLTGILTLSGVGIYNFNTPAALNSAASSQVVLTNGALCQDINWNIGAAVTLGASSTFRGIVQTGVSGAITVGASAIVYGTLSAGNGVVTMGASAMLYPCNQLAVSCAGAAASFAPGTYAIGTNIAAGAIWCLSGQGNYLFNGVALTTGASSRIELTNGADCSDIVWQLTTLTAGASSLMIGDVQATTVTLGASAVVQGSVEAPTVTMGAQASIVSCSGLPSGPSNVYTPGTYTFGTNIIAGGVITLSGQGIYTFNGGALTTGANSQVVLTNGALCSDVTWILTTFTSGADSIMVGNVQATTATLGANSIIQGSIEAGTLTMGYQASIVNCAGISSGPSTIYTPGTYTIGTNIVAGGVITLSGAGAYVFNGVALTTGADSQIVLTNGALCSGVTWDLTTLTTGANSILIGNVNALTATLGANSVIQGSIQATTLTQGAQSSIVSCSGVASGPSTVYTPGTYAIGTNIVASGIITLSGHGPYLFTGVALTTGADSQIVLTNGALCTDVTWQLTTLTTGANSIMIGDVHALTATLGANSIIQGSIEATTLTPGYQSSIVSCSGQASGPSTVYTPGSYAFGTNIVAGGVINLSGAGSYYFTGVALTTGANSQIILTNGATCALVTWQLTTLTTGADSLLVGSVHATTATLGANSVIQGSLVAPTLTQGAGSEIISC